DRDALVAGIARGAGGGVIAEEALSPTGLKRLMDVLEHQPNWSDFPIVLLARAGAASDTGAKTLRALANVQVLERPTQVGELTSAANTALRSRLRQYEIRDN